MFWFVWFGLALRQGLSLAQSSTIARLSGKSPGNLLISASPELGLQACVPRLAFPVNISSRDRTQAGMIDYRVNALQMALSSQHLNLKLLRKMSAFPKPERHVGSWVLH